MAKRTHRRFPARNQQSSIQNPKSKIQNPKSWDLALVALLAALLNLVVFLLPDSPLRLPLGLLLLFILPGHAAASALFPSRKGMDATERAALAMGLSISLLPLVGLLLNLTPWGIRLESVMGAATLLTVGLAGAAALRRRLLPAGEAWVPALPHRLLRTLPAMDRALAVVSAVLIILSAGVMWNAATNPPVREKFTQFYLLNETGTAGGLPVNLTAGGNATVIVGTRNNEGTTVAYTVVVQAQGGLAYRPPAASGWLFTSRPDGGSYNLTGGAAPAWGLTLDHGRRLEEPFTFHLDEPGSYLLRFYLYRKGDAAPYRELHMWVNVAG